MHDYDLNSLQVASYQWGESARQLSGWCDAKWNSTFSTREFSLTNDKPYCIVMGCLVRAFAMQERSPLNQEADWRVRNLGMNVSSLTRESMEVQKYFVAQKVTKLQGKAHLRSILRRIAQMEEYFITNRKVEGSSPSFAYIIKAKVFSSHSNESVLNLRSSVITESP